MLFFGVNVCLPKGYAIFSVLRMRFFRFAWPTGRNFSQFLGWFLVVLQVVVFGLTVRGGSMGKKDAAKASGTFHRFVAERGENWLFLGRFYTYI